MACAVPNYVVLPVKIGKSKFVRHLFVRRHRDAMDGDQKNTLFVANVPAGASCEVCSHTYSLKPAAQ